VLRFTGKQKQVNNEFEFHWPLTNNDQEGTIFQIQEQKVGVDTLSNHKKVGETFGSKLKEFHLQQSFRISAAEVQARQNLKNGDSVAFRLRTLNPCGVYGEWSRDVVYEYDGSVFILLAD
jgi:hypothetical protein